MSRKAKDKEKEKARKKKEAEDLANQPSQSKLLIFGICVCQLTVVLSIVSFIYLSVAIYSPSKRAFNSGFESTPVTCHTLDMLMASNANCSWASCGEWCLTKTSGFCPQITVNVRRNSTDIVLENCSRLSTNSCPQFNPETFKKVNCNNGSECATLTGLFNCSLGHCAKMSDQLLCHYVADGAKINSVKNNNKLSGFFECDRGQCTYIKRHFSCDRKFCPKITTLGINTYLMYDDAVYSGDCGRAVANRASNGSSPGYPIPTTEVWSENSTGGYLLASCHHVERQENTLVATDCINGTVLPEVDMPTPFVNFTTFWSVFEKSARPLDPRGRFLPFQKTLTIFDVSKLFINLDGCVNTLRGECKDFANSKGKDGKNHTAVSRFPCFYNKNDSKMVIARFDLEQTRRELLVSLIVPSVLFALSFTTLLVVSRSVKVDQDSILRCRLCGMGGGNKNEVQPEEEVMALEYHPEKGTLEATDS